MRKLSNTQEDRDFLESLLEKGQPDATFSLGHFTSNLASSLRIVDYTGKVTAIDKKSGYCEWLNEVGTPMPSVNINCVTLHEHS